MKNNSQDQQKLLKLLLQKKGGGGKGGGWRVGELGAGREWGQVAIDVHVLLFKTI
jgi:hypothetical protein